MKPEKDGWFYREPNLRNGEDARKLVTIKNRQNLVWVGIRAWHQANRYWLNGGEPEADTILAWKHLDSPARGFYDRGVLTILEGGV